MKLYHGTSERNLKAILKDGLKPRGSKATGNWDTCPSNPKTVYLTNAYALYYALNAARTGNLLVVEIDTDYKMADMFVPDEDAIEQVLRGRDGVAGDMVTRTMHYRKMLPTLMGGVEHPFVQDSLKALGNCGCMGTVRPWAITRYAIINRKQVDKALLWQAMDPSITVLNYRICGTRYRNMVRWVFGEPLEPQDGLLPFDPPASRAGITIHDMEKRYDR